MSWSAVPFDAEDAGMVPVDEVLMRLAASEPLSGFSFDCGDPDLQASYGNDWAAVGLTDPAPAWLDVPGAGRFQLTRQAARQLGSTARANQRFQEFIPADYLSQHVTWALRKGLGQRSLKLLTAGAGQGPDGQPVPLAVAQTRDTIEPFSNVRLLRTALDAVRSVFGVEAADSAVVDYKFWHDLEHTSFRVAVPAVQRVVTGTGEDDDAWCYGVEVRNSLIGLKQTMVSGYMLRLATTAGCIDVEHASGGFKRRNSTPAQAYAWTASACEDILREAEPALGGLQALAGRRLGGSCGRVLRQLFKDNGVARDLQLRVVSALEEGEDDLTMYGLVAAATGAANLEGLEWRPATSLMLLGGDIVHRGGGMCDGSLRNGCRRLLPEDWDRAEAG